MTSAYGHLSLHSQPERAWDTQTPQRGAPAGQTRPAGARGQQSPGQASGPLHSCPLLQRQRRRRTFLPRLGLRSGRWRQVPAASASVGARAAWSAALGSMRRPRAAGWGDVSRVHTLVSVSQVPESTRGLQAGLDREARMMLLSFSHGPGRPPWSRLQHLTPWPTPAQLPRGLQRPDALQAGSRERLSGSVVFPNVVLTGLPKAAHRDLKAARGMECTKRPAKARAFRLVSGVRSHPPSLANHATRGRDGTENGTHGHSAHPAARSAPPTACTLPPIPERPRDAEGRQTCEAPHLRSRPL